MQEAGRTLWSGIQHAVYGAVVNGGKMSSAFVRTLYSAAQIFEPLFLFLPTSSSSVATVSILLPPAGEALGERQTWTRESSSTSITITQHKRCGY